MHACVVRRHGDAVNITGTTIIIVRIIAPDRTAVCIDQYKNNYYHTNVVLCSSPE